VGPVRESLSLRDLILAQARAIDEIRLALRLDARLAPRRVAERARLALGCDRDRDALPEA